MTDQSNACRPTFRVLGALSVQVEGEYVALPACKPGNMLAGLLVSPNEVTSNDFLSRVVWSDDSDVDTRAALRTCTTRLRKLLLRHNLGDELIETVPGGYRLKAGPADLDLLRFRELVATSVRMADADEQLTMLRDALNLWNGPVLCNVDSEVLHRGVVPLLEEERLQALERVIAVFRANGHDDAALAELQQLTRTYEGHERFALRLAETLNAVGRREDALAECRRIKGYLDDELGLEPTQELRELEVAILRGESSRPVAGSEAIPTAEDAVEDPAEEAIEAAPTSSGIAVQSGFVGREDSLAALTGVLTANPGAPALILVTGAPGIGKTALATAVAGRVKSTYPTAEVVALRTGGRARPTDEVLEEVRFRVGSSYQRVLLVLDDAGDEGQVAEILNGLAGAAALVTASVDLLGLVRSHGAFVHRVRPMTDAEAFALLCSLLGDGRLVEDLTSAHELVRNGWGNPLVLRMIATLMQVRPSWSAQQCVAWLSDDPVLRLSSAGESMSLLKIYQQASDRLAPELRDTVELLANRPERTLGRKSSFSKTQARGLLNGSTDSLLPRLVTMGWLDEVSPDTFHFDRMIAHCLQVDTGPLDTNTTDLASRVTNVFALAPTENTKEGA